MPCDVFPFRKQSLPCLTVNTIIGNQVLVKEDSFTLKKNYFRHFLARNEKYQEKYNLKACRKMAVDTNYSLMGNLG